MGSEVVDSALESEELRKKPLRVATNPDEIMGLFLKMYISHSKVMIWQKVGADNRLINIGYVEDVDQRTRMVIFKPFDMQWLAKMSDQATLYFKGEEESILFRVKAMVFSDQKLVIPIPPEVRVIEKRKNLRIRFDQTQTALRIMLIRIPAAKKLLPQDFCFPIFDISERGVSFRVTKEIQKYFYEGDRVFIEKIANREFRPTLMGVVHYIKIYTYRSDVSRAQEFRVAVVLENKFRKGFLKQLQEMAENS